MPIDRGPFFQFEQGAMVDRDVTLVERPPMTLRFGPRRSTARLPSLRALYVDLDGTLLGRGASLFHDGEGCSR